MIWKEKFSPNLISVILTPNFVTLLRLVFTVVGISILLLSPSFSARLLAFGILLLAALSDLLDGWMARTFGLVTSFGKILDPIADKVLILGVMGAFSFLKLYSCVWVLLIGFREVLVTVVRLVALRKGKVLEAESWGKIKTFSQMISLLVSYLYLFSRDHWSSLSFWPPFLTDLLRAGNISLLVIAVFLTLWSGGAFFVSLAKNR
jgi:CDP-diacylglycerol--glycerol-3-phosphate 3-phosphatidyltransferase